MDEKEKNEEETIHEEIGKEKVFILFSWKKV